MICCECITCMQICRQMQYRQVTVSVQLPGLEESPSPCLVSSQRDQKGCLPYLVQAGAHCCACKQSLLVAKVETMHQTRLASAEDEGIPPTPELSIL